MDADEAWAVIDQQRLALADLLITLTETEWAAPSLCAGWTVREVAGHLTQQIGPGMVAGTVKAVVAARGNVPEAVAESARRTAVRPVGALIADIRSMAGRRRLGDSRTWPFVLVDTLVHGQDIARPVGRRLPMPTAGAREAAERSWKSPMWRAPERLAGFRLTADDTDWSVGDGARVSGSVGQLLLLITGRTAVAAELTGPGQPALVRRLAERG